MYYELKTGRIVTETDLKIAFEICCGMKANDPTYDIWVGTLPVRHLYASEITVERLINGNAFVEAMKLYKMHHNCTLSEAREACDKIRSEKE